jgi:2-keto-4-pentenoate hydratase/2-oxohepta-3-ene-1,7-dioic acid hydratase in catechol pathway
MSALAAGDLIFTGTPAGVSTVLRGDLLEAGCGRDR